MEKKLTYEPVIIKQLYWVVLLGLVGCFLNEQSIQAQPNLSFSYEMNTRASINPVNDFDTIYAWQCVLQLQDTSGISEIHFQMGTTYGQNNLVNHSFVFDDNAFVPNGMGYRRDGYEVKLSVGNFKNRTYYIEVQLEDTLQNTSSPVYWNNF